MGNYYHVYIGPHIKFETNYEEITKEISRCSNPECQLETSTNFCDECGSKIEKEIITVNEKIDMWDKLEEFDGYDDEFFIIDDYLLPNKEVEGQIIYMDQYKGEQEFLIMPDEIPSTQINFINKFRPIIQYLTSLANNNLIKFKIQYGAVSYWN